MLTRALHIQRICEDIAYKEVPVLNCFWNFTTQKKHFSLLNSDTTGDLAIIGAGFTGISAAYHPAQKKMSVVLLNAETQMFGVTGRKGGFCCIGGGKASDAFLDQKFGKPERFLYRQAHPEAIVLVSRLLKTNEIDADRHSNGETQLVHRPKDVEAMVDDEHTIRETYGVNSVFHRKE